MSGLARVNSPCNRLVTHYVTHIRLQHCLLWFGDFAGTVQPFCNVIGYNEKQHVIFVVVKLRPRTIRVSENAHDESATEVLYVSAFRYFETFFVIDRSENFRNKLCHSFVLYIEDFWFFKERDSCQLLLNYTIHFFDVI